MRPFLLFAAPLVLLSACASAGPPGTQAAGAPPPAATPYGMFLAGEAALNDGQSQDAAHYFDMARAQPEAGDLISEKAFSAALLSGDIPRAAALAPTGEGASESAKRMGKLVVGVEALADGKGKEAQALLSPDANAFPHRSAAALMQPWAAAQAGDIAASVVRPQVRGDQLVDYFGQLGQAELLERAKRYDEAEAAFKAGTAVEVPSEMTVLAYGQFLERRGRRLDAVALYEAALAQDPASVDLNAARARAAAGKTPPALPSLREGAAQAMLGPTAAMISGKQTQIALAYLRLILRLDPARDDAWLLVGDIMQGGGDINSARAAYSKPKPNSPQYAVAQSKLAWSYEQADDHATALRIARAAAATGSSDARLTLADLLRANDQFAESAQILTALINEAKTPDWRLYYARGVAYEQMGRWSDTETDLQAALKLKPDEPELLNYLGYSWINRGEHLKDAMSMVERAVAANPRSGAMVDSLGWAYYRLGDYPNAVEKLEQAVELDAGDPEINNHLGDAYWKVGRKDEALFQWRRVLTLQPDDKIKASAETKLASGLGPDGPSPKLALP
jgi:tetratricopeptide (TPR) repeat protein